MFCLFVFVYVVFGGGVRGGRRRDVKGLWVWIWIWMLMRCSITD